ncbi:MAG: dTMP kinase [Candidatus Calescibacterium sp.]|nr:dTMP kinase [Candidatus Calescibacterium sp.]MCX7734211.1 dTMP kinase [bacterium]MDW8086527.1 dTMP kinase [Candidatus Calescibacterium sp.]
MDFDLKEWISRIKSLKDIPRFIAFEGIEGSGKTTQAKLLGSFLKKCGFNVKVVRDPGFTPLGEKIRKILKSEVNIDSVSELFLFLAARRQLVVDVVRPALRKGIVVITDRFTNSTLAYQGRGRGLMPETLPMLCYIATGGVEPELTFVLDIDPEKGLQRAKKRSESEKSKEDRFEAQDIQFHRRIREFYAELAENSENVFIIDSSQDIYSVFADVVSKLYEFSKEKF